MYSARYDIVSRAFRCRLDENRCLNFSKALLVKIVTCAFNDLVSESQVSLHLLLSEIEVSVLEPQLIVYMTMGLGSTIITEATLSFLGLGVRFPFASWGNIINDVNDTFVLTNYWFIWIPAGVLLLTTVLAFNIVGDGLRDAFDPKMKR